MGSASTVITKASVAITSGAVVRMRSLRTFDYFQRAPHLRISLARQHSRRRVTAARAFAGASEAAVADLERRIPAGMSPLEQALAARIRAAVNRLLECRGAVGARR